MEKFDLLVKILSDLQDAGILKHLVLVGSWCQDFYRYQFGNPPQIPATKTMDADILIPRRIPHIDPPVNIAEIMIKNDFILDFGLTSGLYHFNHPLLQVDFLTEPGAKSETVTRHFKQLGVTAQELQFMSLPLSYNYPFTYKNITLNIPEPEAFALHKLITCQRRINKEKAEKDRITADGMFQFIQTDPKRIERLHQIFSEFSKGWQKTIQKALVSTGLELPR